MGVKTSKSNRIKLSQMRWKARQKAHSDAQRVLQTLMQKGNVLFGRDKGKSCNTAEVCRAGGEIKTKNTKPKREFKRAPVVLDRQWSQKNVHHNNNTSNNNWNNYNNDKSYHFIFTHSAGLSWWSYKYLQRKTQIQFIEGKKLHWSTVCTSAR